MKNLIIASIAIGLVIPSMSAVAQESRVSEDEARCFVQGICKVEEEKKFTLANISTTKKDAAPTPAAPAPRVKPAGNRYSAAKGGVDGGGRPRTPGIAPAPVVGQPKSLDMRLTFELGSDQLTPEARAQADVFAKVLSESAATPGRFLIEGHTDSIGSRASNLDLSRRRAQSVVSYLLSHGVSAAKLQAEGYGYSRPRTGLTAADPSNRRVEIVRN